MFRYKYYRNNIKGNIIEGDHSENGIYISGASDVLIRSNEISGCTKPLM